MAASRCRSLAKPSFSLLRSTFTKPATRTSPTPSLLNSRPSVASQSFGSAPQLGCLQSLLPLYSAVSSARLTSCLGIDTTSSRSMCQGMLCSANPGNLVLVCPDDADPLVITKSFDTAAYELPRTMCRCFCC